MSVSEGSEGMVISNPNLADIDKHSHVIHLRIRRIECQPSRYSSHGYLFYVTAATENSLPHDLPTPMRKLGGRCLSLSCSFVARCMCSHHRHFAFSLACSTESPLCSACRNTCVKYPGSSHRKVGRDANMHSLTTMTQSP